VKIPSFKQRRIKMNLLACIGMTVALAGLVVLLVGEFINCLKKPFEEYSKYTVEINYNSIEEAREILFETYTDVVRKDG
jgi:hypothetical protein